MEMSMEDKCKMLLKKGSRRLAVVASRGLARSAPGRLASLVKEQRTRFYIMCRCITMLVCWRD